MLENHFLAPNPRCPLRDLGYQTTSAGDNVFDAYFLLSEYRPQYVGRDNRSRPSVTRLEYRERNGTNDALVDNECHQLCSCLSSFADVLDGGTGDPVTFDTQANRRISYHDDSCPRMSQLGDRTSCQQRHETSIRIYYVSLPVRKAGVLRRLLVELQCSFSKTAVICNAQQAGRPRGFSYTRSLRPEYESRIRGIKARTTNSIRQRARFNLYISESLSGSSQG